MFSDFERQQMFLTGKRQFEQQRAEQARAEFDRQWTIASLYKQVPETAPTTKAA